MSKTVTRFIFTVVACFGMVSLTLGIAQADQLTEVG